ncbi:hypothetical protein [Sphingobium sp. BS19]|uniref:hypothetical protein n=1 Tax=Sphingobium sp. BS19 TaxID=3018973 RepID=UPI0024919EA0|nr:hypothetical protein [Sphingobium sp. BS19]
MTMLVVDEDGEARLVHRVPPGEARREHVLRDLIAAHRQSNGRFWPIRARQFVRL